MTDQAPVPAEDEFRAFIEMAEPRLHRTLVARFGWERGREAAAEALGYAWEHWTRVQGMRNPVGYLYRVGQSRVRTLKIRPIFDRPEDPEHWFEPSLARVLSELPGRQRVAVVLIHGYGWTAQEVADLLDLQSTTVQNHLARALSRLRQELEVEDRV